MFKRFKFIGFLMLMFLSISTYKSTVYAQTRELYTSENFVMISFEGLNGMLEYGSNDLQVRYNKATQRIECRIPVNSLFALNDTVPAELAYDVLFGAKYPDLLVFIDATSQIVNSPNLNAEPKMQRATVELQGKPNETRIPVVFASDKGYINLSTHFDLVMGNFQATIPSKYLPFLSGRIRVTIRNARWINSLD